MGLVLDFKRFRGFWGRPNRMRAGWRAFACAGWLGSAGGRLGAGSCFCSAGLGGCRGLFGRLFVCSAAVSCPVCRVSVRGAVVARPCSGGDVRRVPRVLVYAVCASPYNT